MAEYVEEHISADYLESIYDGTYVPDDLESAAVDAYFDIPIIDRIEMHDQELCDLRTTKSYLETWGEHQEEIERVTQLLHEEMQWIGGHE